MNFPYEKLTESAEATEIEGRELASLIASDARLPRFVAMYGDLGVGKTAFVRGFCSELCYGVTVKSPTFALVNEYKCATVKNGIKKVCHFDMYRIADEDDLYSIGFYDYLRADSVCIAEWCEMIPYALPDSYIKVEITKEDLGNKRKILISYIGV
ncbi:MAG: tRNA (adenosine(37)-N6)-threonylcarbamoyltransferase complex ATPase subunit type 1 TsaE [Clostridia bacterium]|nr:tRNA (adenosine(37)-N6)-threonylcarbamoyltransferase complex ATPase subunit type 1 TsaE [Clostridia bacterium]